MKILLPLCLFLLSGALSAQAMFSNQRATLLPSPVYSGVAIGVSDLNGDGLDDIFRLDDGDTPNIAIQQADGSFTIMLPQETVGNVWGLCIADVDNDGLNDISVGTAFGGTSLLRTTNTTGLSWVLQDMPDTDFQQGSNFVDIDNDGWVDHFACDDVALSVPSRNNGDGTFTEDYSLINPVSTVPSDNSGNYASVWTDYDNDGDQDLYISKCRLGVADANDGRRLNQMFRNDGPAGFTDVAEAIGLLPRAQCWATDFADVDNDGDLDAFLVNHDSLSQLMINDGNGVFTNATTEWGMTPSLTSASSLGIQCNFEDFNNDGWIDLVVTYNASFAYVYQNTGTGAFNLISGNSLVTGISEQTFQSVATGDFNNDGYVDMYTGHASGFNNPTGTPDGVLMNNGGTNGFLTVRLQGVSSNRMGVGARIQIYGSWGVQTREVRSGESYGVSNSLTSFFGVGTDATITRLVVRWPSGLEEETFNIAANSRLVITEGSLSNTLPLEWRSLTATAVDGKRVRLDWQTEQEEATSHFFVERKAGTNWTSIGRVAAESTPGTNDYHLYDEQAQSGENIYRVRQVDLTGAESFSPLAAVSLAGESFTLFPNPASGTTSIRGLPAGFNQVSLETLDGKIIRNITGTELNLTDIPAGVYLVRSGKEVQKLVVR